MKVAPQVAEIFSASAIGYADSGARIHLLEHHLKSRVGITIWSSQRLKR